MKSAHENGYSKFVVSVFNFWLVGKVRRNQFMPVSVSIIKKDPFAFPFDSFTTDR